MNKRRFLQTLPGLTATGLFEGAQGRAPSFRKSGKGLKLQSFPKAGFQYCEGEKIRPDLKTGEEPTLQREPDNPHGKRAVAVYWREHKLGYIPRRENVAVAQLLDNAELPGAFIEELGEAVDPCERLRLSVRLNISDDHANSPRSLWEAVPVTGSEAGIRATIKTGMRQQG